MILLDASVRIFVVAILAALILRVLCVRSSAVRHRAWTLVLCAMLLMPVLPAIVPAVGVPIPGRVTRILPSVATAPDARAIQLPVPRVRLDRPDGAGPAAGRSEQLVSAEVIPRRTRIVPLLLAAYLAVAGVLLLRLAIGFRAVRHLTRLATPVDVRSGLPVYASPAVAAPVTIGIVNPIVLLPPSWADWPAEKLRACLAHEGAHVRRRDAMVAFAAHINRAMFWFHPLAWWLERTLAATAEHAADDEALREIGHRERYAEILLDMAEAVRLHGGRVSWHGVGIDGSSALGRRIDRLLGGPHGDHMSRARKAFVLVACGGVVLIVFACRRQAPPPLQPDAKVAARFDEQKKLRALADAAENLTRPEVDALEGSLTRTTADFETLRKLKLFYQTSGHTALGWNEIIARRRPHILWLIDSHPDHELAMWRISPTADRVTYAEAKKRWLAQASRLEASDKILTNAAYFLEEADPELAIQTLMRMRDTVARARHLGEVYAGVVKGPTSPRDGSPLTPFDSDPYARVVRRRLDESQEPILLASAGRLLATTYRDTGRRELGRRLLARAVQIDPQQRAAARMLATYESEERFNAINEKIRARTAEIAGVVPGTPLSADQRRTLRDAEVRAVAELSERERFDVLRELADRTYMSGESFEWNKDSASAAAAYARSKKYAQDALSIAERFRDDPYYGAYVYRARVAMALHALREGNTAAAVRLMHEATDVPASRGFETHVFGLDSRLMSYLLDRGERESVAEFLEQSADLRQADRDRLLKDAAAIRAGYMPSTYQRMVSLR